MMHQARVGGRHRRNFSAQGSGPRPCWGRRLGMPADLLTGLQFNAAVGLLVATARPCPVSRADFQRLETTQDESQAKGCGHKRGHAAEGSLRLFQPMLRLQLSHHPNHRHPGTQSASARARAGRNWGALCLAGLSRTSPRPTALVLFFRLRTRFATTSQNHQPGASSLEVSCVLAQRPKFSLTRWHRLSAPIGFAIDSSGPRIFPKR